MVDLGGQEVKDQGHRRLKPGGDIILDLLRKGGGVLHIVLTAPTRVYRICVLLTHLFLLSCRRAHSRCRSICVKPMAEPRTDRQTHSHLSRRQTVYPTDRGRVTNEAAAYRCTSEGVSQHLLASAHDMFVSSCLVNER